MNPSPTVLIAGGGTGGHVFPGLAIADALRGLADVDVRFVGSPRGLEVKVVPPRGYALELFDVEPMQGGGVARLVRGGTIAARETARALIRLRHIAPRAVLSVGGYAAGPAALAAVALRIPLAVLEPNATVGLANRWLAPFAARAYVAWEQVGHVFGEGRVRVVGVPLRAGFVPSPYAPSSRVRVLVMGGSQGAAALNERIPLAIARAAASITPAASDASGASVEVVHQAGRDRDAAVRDAYARAGVKRVTVVPFIDDVARAIAEADLVVARAGAATVAEIAAIGRASLLIPFPHAAYDHQAKNANALARLGGAIGIRQEDASVERLAAEITRLVCDGAARVAMADAARAHGQPGAAMSVARDFLGVAGIDEGRPGITGPGTGPAPGSNGVHRAGTSAYGGP